MRQRSKSKYKGFEAPPGQKRTARWSRSSGFQAPPSAPVPRPDMWAQAPGDPFAGSAGSGTSTREELPPLEDWPPPEIKARWAAQRERQRRNRELRRRGIVAVVVIVSLVAGVVALTKIGGRGRAKPAAAPPPSQLLAWSVNLGITRLVT